MAGGMGRAREASGAATVFYCATCGVVYAEDQDGRIGLRFLCPNDAPDRPAHLASVEGAVGAAVALGPALAGPL